MIIFKINVEGVFALKRKRHAPVAADCDAPGASPIALQLGASGSRANSNLSSTARD